MYYNVSMNTKELNRYLEDYVMKDKSHRAVMLVAPWGEGKTFYINNTLKDHFIENKLDFVNISLYGIKDLAELNKQLFLEIKLGKLKKKKGLFGWISSHGRTILSGAVGVGKTILKNVAHIDVDIDLKEPKWSKMFENVNLKKKLIIFDDVERSNIDIIEFLGYVNNLVEIDGVKVLLIANEDELIKYDNKINDDGKSYKVLTNKSIQYLKIKEKTVLDTIKFNCDYDKALDDIIKLFSGKVYNKVINHKSKIMGLETKDIILFVMKDVKNFNLRSILYACQKMANMFDKLVGNYDVEMLQNIFLGTIGFCLKNNMVDVSRWDGDYTSQYLGTYKYPMYRVAYKFIKEQVCDEEEMQLVEKMFKIAIEIELLNDDLKVLYNYYNEKEEDVVDALFSLKDLLLDYNRIPFSEYIKLGNYLESIKPFIDQNAIINNCKQQMIKNVQNAIKEQVEIKFYSMDGIHLPDEQQRKSFNKFKTKLQEIASKQYKYVDIYTPNAFCEFAEKNRSSFMGNKAFALNLNITKFENMLLKSSSKDLGDIRGAFLNIYSFSNLKDYYLDDLDNLKKIYLIVLNLMKNKRMDKIQKMQLKFFKDNLKEIMETIMK